RWAAALAGGAALIAAAVWGLRSGRVGEAAPPPAAGISVAPAPSAGAQSTRPAETPSARVEAAPAPAQRPARRAARAASPLPSPSPPASPSPAASGQLRILCSPWCIPIVDGKAV